MIGSTAKASRPPKRVYKYRAFSDRVLDMLVFDKLYFSDPQDFNDPLETRPHLEPDLPARSFCAAGEPAIDMLLWNSSVTGSKPQELSAFDTSV